ncbi:MULTISPECIES: histidine--tRNA ligase [unclassified Rhizobium]|uniref:histidine--tRNA ligase n=1 Tax=unclassified Rhizobium TaxID=2613769 RepID=UPI001ADD0017|nr:MULTISPECIES: histidine--tRNA ligase [unclassified Rhizobium]MBO9097386.1 histidine--tRNA ligase [Rhizobium sp. L58/93]MBO9133762.1 histidine--tRNA ligase [Rhizobium sp. B209b/85]MBO9167625.1 histidine--tRNA ligase [Rhizobium sp. L245/93]MBO9183584.1 histidine--tRNA ligase [Rhizobium sp. E27B/91]QXZ83910.1 histidine--tRNA ligase [Rhizobium sp. K1/93]
MNDKPKKPQKLRARLPRGFGDRTAADIHATNEMVAKIREVYERYGFDPIETPQFEYTDALGKFLPDSDRPNEGVFSLQDDDEQWMSLRYDLTAPLARHVAENFNEIQLPYRTYRQGYVFRNEKPGPGRFRQFMQFDADSVGAPGVQSDAEMCMMMADTLEALGIKRGDYVIRVNNRKVLDGVMEAAKITDPAQKLTVLRALDKFDKFGWAGVKLLLGDGRKDESGDFTKGAGLNDDQIKVLEWYINVDELADGGLKQNLDFVSSLEYLFADKSEIGTEGFAELKTIASIITSAGYLRDRIRIDTSVVRGLEYYTGPVYEAELTFDVTNEKGEKVVFGSVGGGGRYDGLVSRFMGQPVPATGFSIGVSRLMTALKNLGKLGQDEVLAPVLVTVMDSDIESLGGYQRLTQALRGAGIRAEMYQGSAKKKIGDQLKYADRRGCSIAIIQGGNERAEGVVQIKDLIEGKRLSGEIEDNASWREARVAQEIVPEAEIVAKVQAMLAAQAEDRKRAMQGQQA